MKAREAGHWDVASIESEIASLCDERSQLQPGELRALLLVGEKLADYMRQELARRDRAA